MIEAGDFSQYAIVHGDYKGTARQSVEPHLAAGRDVLLEIDWQGARQVREKVPDCVTIFILPPSREGLVRRLRGGGKDAEETILRRLAGSRGEMEDAPEFDSLVVNRDFDRDTEELLSIIRAQRLRTSLALSGLGLPEHARGGAGDPARPATAQRQHRV